jgi:hypothetical protein
VAEEIAYLDSSAIVKTIIKEPESVALARFLRAYPVHAASGLARAEVLRAVRRANERAVARVHDAMGRLVLLEVTDELLTAAGLLEPPTLRTLDAIHLASARMLSAQLGALVTYDQRMAASAAALGLPVVTPA